MGKIQKIIAAIGGALLVVLGIVVALQFAQNRALRASRDDAVTRDIDSLRTEFATFAADLKTGLATVSAGLVNSQSAVDRIKSSIDRNTETTRQFTSETRQILDGLGDTIARAIAGNQSAEDAIGRLEQYNQRVGSQFGFSGKTNQGTDGQNGSGLQGAGESP